MSLLPGIFGIYASCMNHCYLGFLCWPLPKIFTMVWARGQGELLHPAPLNPSPPSPAAEISRGWSGSGSNPRSTCVPPSLGPATTRPTSNHFLIKLHPSSHLHCTTNSKNIPSAHGHTTFSFLFFFCLMTLQAGRQVDWEKLLPVLMADVLKQRPVGKSLQGRLGEINNLHFLAWATEAGARASDWSIKQRFRQENLRKTAIFLFFFEVIRKDWIRTRWKPCLMWVCGIQAHTPHPVVLLDQGPQEVDLPLDTSLHHVIDTFTSITNNVTSTQDLSVYPAISTHSAHKHRVQQANSLLWPIFHFSLGRIWIKMLGFHPEQTIRETSIIIFGWLQGFLWGLAVWSDLEVLKGSMQSLDAWSANKCDETPAHASMHASSCQYACQLMPVCMPAPDNAMPQHLTLPCTAIPV